MEGSPERYRIKEIELKQDKGTKRDNGNKDMKKVRFDEKIIKEGESEEEDKSEVKDKNKDNDKEEDKHDKDRGAGDR